MELSVTVGKLSSAGWIIKEEISEGSGCATVVGFQSYRNKLKNLTFGLYSGSIVFDAKILVRNFEVSETVIAF